LLLLGAAVAFSLAAYFLVGGIGFIVIIPFVFPIFMLGRGPRDKPRDDREAREGP
jgi:hypothetical protein